MDNSIVKALALKEELEDKIGELQAKLGKVSAYIDLHDALFGTKDAQNESITMSDSDVKAALARIEVAKKNRGLPAAVAKAAERLIRQAGRPMQRGELVDLMKAEGMVFGSPDAPRYIGTVLWRRDDIFENIEGRGYWLKGEPLTVPRDALDLYLGQPD